MSKSDKKLEREIDLSKLLKSDERTKWESEHIVCYGIYDEQGLETLNKVEKIDAKSLGEIASITRLYSLRARFNSHRNTEVYIVWLHKNSLYLIDKMFEKGDYMRAKSTLIKHGHKC